MYTVLRNSSAYLIGFTQDLSVVRTCGDVYEKLLANIALPEAENNRSYTSGQLVGALDSMQAD